MELDVVVKEEERKKKGREEGRGGEEKSPKEAEVTICVFAFFFLP